MYKNRFGTKFNLWIRASGNVLATARWISLRSELLGSLTVFGASIFGILSKTLGYIEDISLIGLSISSTLLINSVISYSIRMMAETEL